MKHEDTNQTSVQAIIAELRRRLPSVEALTQVDPADVTDIGPDITIPAIWLSIVLASHDFLRVSALPQPIDTAPKDGGWILGLVREEIDDTYRQPWAIVSWGDGAESHDFGWYDDDGLRREPVQWVPLPDPQPFPTGWAPPCGTIKIAEITGEGWTCNGEPCAVPWRWVVFIEKPDGAHDEYREAWHAVTIDEAVARAERWRQKFGLPVVTVPLDGNVIPLRPKVTRQ